MTNAFLMGLFLYHSCKDDAFFFRNPAMINGKRKKNTKVVPIMSTLKRLYIFKKAPKIHG